jgi:hypothetical protein
MDAMAKVRMGFLHKAAAPKPKDMASQNGFNGATAGVEVGRIVPRTGS